LIVVVARCAADLMISAFRGVLKQAGLRGAVGPIWCKYY
jgi:hypothetical protein